MKDISRRSILRGATLTGLSAVGVGAATPASAGPEDELRELLGDDTAADSEDEDPCDVTVDPSSDGVPDTIQAGVDQASPGTRDDPTTVCIAPGTYQESVTIDTDGIALVGVGGADDTTIESTGTTVSITGTDVVLFKLTVDGTDGTAVDAGPRTVVRNCRIVADDTMTVTTDGDPLSVVQNEFVDRSEFDDTGTAVQAANVRGELGGEADGIYVAGNTFSGFRHAIELIDCKKVAIKSNTFELSWYSAIQVESLAGTSGVELILVENNEFLDNTNAVILYEEGESAEIRDVGVVRNEFRDYFWGVLTSTQKVAVDFDNDGEEEMVEVAGPLGGGVVDARCNYWGRSTGPRSEDNDLTVESPVPAWVVPRPIKSGVDSVVPRQADMTVEDAVDYRPWRLEPPAIADVVPGWFPPGEWALPGELQTDCGGGVVTGEL